MVHLQPQNIVTPRSTMQTAETITQRFEKFTCRKKKENIDATHFVLEGAARTTQASKGSIRMT